MSDRNFTWREATHDDIPNLVALVNSAYRGDSGRRGWTTESDLLGGQRVDERLLAATLEKSTIVCAFSGETLSGCVNLEKRDENVAYLGMLTVDVRTQSSGLGSYLLNISERFAHENWKTSRIEMTVIAQRDELIRWYEKRGYRKTGERREFPYGDERFGIPLRPDLYFEVLEKNLSEPSRHQAPAIPHL